MTTDIAPLFVTAIPANLEPGVLYVSTEYRTASHLCCCGCGLEVVTPLSPTDWAVRFDGIDVSLTPSIGNWSFPCRSHYWISDGRIRWSRGWTEKEVAAGRARDADLKRAYYGEVDGVATESSEAGVEIVGRLRRAWRWILKRWSAR